LINELYPKKRSFDTVTGLLPLAVTYGLIGH